MIRINLQLLGVEAIVADSAHTVNEVVLEQGLMDHLVGGEIEHKRQCVWKSLESLVVTIPESEDRKAKCSADIAEY